MCVHYEASYEVSKCLRKLTVLSIFSQWWVMVARSKANRANGKHDWLEPCGILCDPGQKLLAVTFVTHVITSAKPESEKVESNLKPSKAFWSEMCCPVSVIGWGGFAHSSKSCVESVHGTRKSQAHHSGAKCAAKWQKDLSQSLIFQENKKKPLDSNWTILLGTD